MQIFSATSPPFTAALRAEKEKNNKLSDAPEWRFQSEAKINKNRFFNPARRGEFEFERERREGDNKTFPFVIFTPLIWCLMEWTQFSMS